jgi:HEAT repeat protein
MNKLAKKLSPLCALILLFNQHLYAQESTKAKEDVESPFILKITYKNYGKKSNHLVKVGIKVSNVSDQTICLGVGLWFSRGPRSYFSDTLQLQANYIVALHISNNETIIDAYPPIEIKPDEAEYFTISFLPSYVGHCSRLISFEVSGILIFDNGEEVYVTPKQNRITVEEVDKFIKRTPDQAELLSAINSRNIEIRRQAFSQLPKSTFNSEELKFFINQGLSNEDPGIKAATAISASKLGFKVFTKKIASLLKSSLSNFDARVKLKQERLKELEKAIKSIAMPQVPSGGLASAQSARASVSKPIESRDALLTAQIEIADYCKALGRLQEADGIDALIAALINLNFEFPEEASDALIKLSHPDVLNDVRPLLSEENYYLQERYVEVLKIIIAYRDMKSVDIVLDLTDKSNNLRSSVVSQISQMTGQNQIIRDPFILAMRPVMEKTLKDLNNSFDRFRALQILSLMPLSEDIIQGYFRTIFKDKDFNNRVNAALLAAELGHKALADDIIKLLKSSESKFEKEIYCKALEKLEVPCQ